MPISYIEKLEEIKSQFQNGVRMEEIARHFSFSEQGMRAFCDGLVKIGYITKEERTKRRSILVKTRCKKLNEERDEKIRTLYQDERKRVKDIADEFSLTEMGVHSIIRRNGYKRIEIPYPENLASSILGYETNNEDIWRILKFYINKLSEREKLVISEKYENGKTYAEIGELLSISRQRAKAICAYSFRKIRQEKEIGEIIKKKASDAYANKI